MMSNKIRGEFVDNGIKVYYPLEKCPHCGRKLSAWEQVLLKVDGALICKNCWYRILLSAFVDKNTSE